MNSLHTKDQDITSAEIIRKPTPTKKSGDLLWIIRKPTATIKVVLERRIKSVMDVYLCQDKIDPEEIPQNTEIPQKSAEINRDRTFSQCIFGIFY